eukprot:TRINITY_DN6332_c0_g2_i1.p1 TRINITY_DN6332_c0_g2~~TRINITY_DN6332_c0_g2_i1.p1  ORF type:complete len:395 (+),score=85.95 TRINITY_DN6332_c0_g2_i1:184-1368(+)
MFGFKLGVGGNGDGEKQKKDVAALNQFSFQLQSRLNQNSSNNFAMGPYSIALALSVAAVGAQGNTYQEIIRALCGTDHPLDKVNTFHAKLMQQLSEIASKDPANIRLMLGNMVMLAPSCGEILPPFASALHNIYQGEHFPLSSDASQKANSWISEKTAGKITDLIPDDLAGVVAMIINAIYFKGTWHHKFPKQGTNPEVFYHASGSSKQVPMMRLREKVTYYNQPNFKAIDLPYGAHLSENMLVATIVLPEMNQPYRETIQEATQTWASWTAAPTGKPTVIVKVPRFKVSTKTQLNDGLLSMGIVSAFGSGANFSKIASSSSGIFVSAVLHQAVVEVNEEGTEAAAATAIVMTKSLAMHDRPITFVCDKPFLFVVRELKTGLVLFSVDVMDPTE